MPRTAIPVSVDLDDADMTIEVTRYVESVLRWQVVVDSPALPALLLIVSTPLPGRRCLVVSRSADAADVRRSLHAGAIDHLVWPGDAERLAAHAPAAAAPEVAADQLIGVASAAPGVGASTVTLLLAGALAWRGKRSVALGEPALCRLAGLSEDAASAAGAAAPQPVAGVKGLGVATRSLPPSRMAEVDSIVLDLGVSTGGHVLVARADGALVAALARRPRWGCVVTVGDGAMHPQELARLLAGQPHVAIPNSFRLGRAGLECRLPVGAPGWAVKLAGQVADALVGDAEDVRSSRRRPRRGRRAA